ncbi:MAG: Alpha N-terminal protein methyltransferase 1 [Alectoria sarmentosa]|nr:MAG: Alpha N-terminal protein methyltransferase 1 [Alectoria sarmentosa]
MAPSTEPAPDANICTSDSLKYWNSISTSVNGMLGGYPEISRTDLKGSANFFAKLRRERPSQSANGRLQRGADCGAGIGRITAGFLSTVCEVVDVVEPVDKFAQEVKGQKMLGTGSVGSVYVSGLEDWLPEAQYDLIWNQWCLGYLTDKLLVAYLERCKDAVTIDGWIIIKENMSTNVDGEDIFDQEDSSVTRTDQKFRQLFKEADMRLIKTEVQRGFPKGLFPVRFYALKP